MEEFKGIYQENRQEIPFVIAEIGHEEVRNGPAQVFDRFAGSDAQKLLTDDGILNAGDQFLEQFERAFQLTVETVDRSDFRDDGCGIEDLLEKRKILVFRIAQIDADLLAGQVFKFPDGDIEDRETEIRSKTEQDGSQVTEDVGADEGVCSGIKVKKAAG